jgi:hypothetical protein
MALATVAEALAQYNANPPSTWTTDAAAGAALDAIYFLLANRATRLEDMSTSINFESLESVKTTLETRLGTMAPRANGRSRRVLAAFQESGLQ